MRSMVVVIYDVSDDLARQKLSRVLEAWGLYRIQRSAFVGRLQWARARDLSRLASRIVDPSSDVVHIMPIEEHQWRRALVVGRPRWGLDASLEGVRVLT